jgi:hypothetical protein
LSLIEAARIEHEREDDEINEKWVQAQDEWKAEFDAVTTALDAAHAQHARAVREWDDERAVLEQRVLLNNEDVERQMRAHIEQVQGCGGWICVKNTLQLSTELRLLRAQYAEERADSDQTHADAQRMCEYNMRARVLVDAAIDAYKQRRQQWKQQHKGGDAEHSPLSSGDSNALATTGLCWAGI